MIYQCGCRLPNDKSFLFGAFFFIFFLVSILMCSNARDAGPKTGETDEELHWWIDNFSFMWFNCTKNMIAERVFVVQNDAWHRFLLKNPSFHCVWCVLLEEMVENSFEIGKTEKLIEIVLLVTGKCSSEVSVGRQVQVSTEFSMISIVYARKLSDASGQYSRFSMRKMYCLWSFEGKAHRYVYFPLKLIEAELWQS